jgi:hypothetical protein
MADTTYTVLIASPGGRIQWSFHREILASSSSDAIRKVVTEPGKYVAVPARSWKPVTVTTETKTVLKLEQPDTPA